MPGYGDENSSKVLFLVQESLSINQDSCYTINIDVNNNFPFLFSIWYKRSLLLSTYFQSLGDSIKLKNPDSWATRKLISLYSVDTANKTKDY